QHVERNRSLRAEAHPRRGAAGGTDLRHGVRPRPHRRVGHHDGQLRMLPGTLLREREPQLAELMDDPECDEAKLQRTYRGFRVLNPVVAGWRRTYAHLIRPLLS